MAGGVDAAAYQRARYLSLEHRTVREAWENRGTGEIETDPQEISEFALSILNDRVNGVAIGFFYTIAHYLYYWFSTPYSTLYDFKASMRTNFGILSTQHMYQRARIFRFADGTPFYDCTNHLAIRRLQRREYIAANLPQNPRGRSCILFAQNPNQEPEFSRERGTKYLVADNASENRLAIHEILSDEHRNTWYFDRASRLHFREIAHGLAAGFYHVEDGQQAAQQARAAGRQDLSMEPLIDYNLVRQEQQIQIQLPSASRNTNQPSANIPKTITNPSAHTNQSTQNANPAVEQQNPVKAQPSSNKNPEAIPQAIVSCLKDVYGCKEIPPLVETSAGIRIFNDTGLKITYEKEEFEENITAWLLTITDYYGHPRNAYVDVDRDDGICTEAGSLQLQCFNSEQDFVLINGDKEKPDYFWVNQPGKQGICLRSTLALSSFNAYLLDFKTCKPLPEENYPQFVDRALKRNNGNDLPVYRVATTQKDLHLFYAGSALTDIVQNIDGTLHVNSKSGALDKGKVIDKNTKHPLKFAVKRPDDHILIMDNGIGKFRILQQDVPDREITFSKFKGTPECRYIQAKLESKTNDKS